MLRKNSAPAFPFLAVHIRICYNNTHKGAFVWQNWTTRLKQIHYLRSQIRLDHYRKIPEMRKDLEYSDRHRLMGVIDDRILPVFKELLSVLIMAAIGILIKEAVTWFFDRNNGN